MYQWYTEMNDLETLQLPTRIGSTIKIANGRWSREHTSSTLRSEAAVKGGEVHTAMR